MKRYRAPKLADGELRVYWGKMPKDAPDIIFAWQGESGMKRDSRFLSYHFGSKQPDCFVTPLFSKMNPSFFEELESRGYDITTLKFSIKKKSSTMVGG